MIEKLLQLLDVAVLFFVVEQCNYS